MRALSIMRKAICRSGYYHSVGDTLLTAGYSCIRWRMQACIDVKHGPRVTGEGKTSSPKGPTHTCNRPAHDRGSAANPHLRVPLSASR